VTTENEPGSPADATSPGWVRYDKNERKETRLRPDQISRLTELSRGLKGRGERITENTLIRVAIDLLFSRAGDLAGATEAELRHSLGL